MPFPRPARRRPRRRALAITGLTALGVLASAAMIAATVLAPDAPGAAAQPAPATAKAARLPAIGHVFIITLENKGYGETFGNPSADPYLATTLPRQGTLLTQYYGTGHESNDNYVSMISGQAPNPQNQADCQVYSDFAGTGPVVPPGQAAGSGCVFPRSVPTLASQLTAAGRSWKGYMQDMGNDPAREAAVCGHPALNAQDRTQSAVPGDGYLARHDPFVYFHAIIDDQAYCDAHVVPLGDTDGTLPGGVLNGTTGLAADLKSLAATPALSYIVPNACNDGHDYPCVNQPSGASALADVDAFLSAWVPKILASPAYKRDGLLVITFDESEGPQGDSTACCDERPGPNSPLPGITGPGGGRTGAVLLSPFIAPGTVSSTPYNHYSLLASVESELGLGRLGYAASAPATFGWDVFKR